MLLRRERDEKASERIEGTIHVDVYFKFTEHGMQFGIL
jgi:hypothetical protein